MRLVWNVTLTRDSAGRLEDPAPLWDAVGAYADAVTRPDTEVEVRFLDRCASAMAYPAVSLLNGAIVVEDVRRSAAEGADAVLIAAAGEPGLHEARSAVDIPVVGSIEAGLALSQFLGRRVGIVTINAAYEDILAHNVRRYGLADRLAGPDAVRHFELSWDAVAQALAGDPDPLVAPFESVVAGLVRDGADVILGGGQIFGALLHLIGAEPGPVPILDCATAGLKAAEVLVDLRRAVGLRPSDAPGSTFRRVPDAELDAAFAALYATG